MRSIARALSAALLVLAPLAGCGDDAPTAPSPADTFVFDAVIEDITDAELLGDAGLEDLSEEDRARVREILRDGRARLAEVRRAALRGELTREEAREAARAIHADVLEQLGRFLTEEQIERLERRLHDRRLDLTPEQLEEMRALRQEFRAFVRDQRAKVEAGELTGEEARANVREAARRLRAAICEILSEAQGEEAPFCRPPEPAG